MPFTIFVLQKVLRTTMLRGQLLYAHSFGRVIHDLKEHQNNSLKKKSILQDEAGWTSAFISESDLWQLHSTQPMKSTHVFPGAQAS